MATSFECDPDAARQVSGELTTIRGDVTATEQLGAGPGVTGSSRVDGALREFVTDSTDSRHNLEQLLDRAGGMLRGLADGATAVDRSLADALTPTPPSAASPATASPNPPRSPR